MEICSKRNFYSSSISYKNTYYQDKPNEDFIINDDVHGIYIMLDGVSVDRVDGKYPNPSPALEVTKLFGDSVYSTLLTCSNDEYIYQIKNALLIANLEIRKYNSLHKLPFDAGTVGIVSLIRNDCYFYSYIGDCFGYIKRNNCIEMFTQEQTYLVKMNKKNLTTKEIRFEICNNIDHPYGYGVYNGSDGAFNFVKFGKINLSNIDEIILYTDGYDTFIKNNLFEDTKKFFKLAKIDNQPDKKIDDRSIIIITINNR